jgi:hypothetical protein
MPVGRYSPTKHLDLAVQLGVVSLEFLEPASPEFSTFHLTYSIHHATSSLRVDPLPAPPDRNTIWF